MITSSDSSNISSSLSLGTSRDLPSFFEDSTYTVEFWRDRAFDLKDALRSYMLVEIRLYKNTFHVEHEFLLAKFQSPSHTRYVVAERRSDHPINDQKVTREECERQLSQDKVPKALRHLSIRMKSVSDSNTSPGEKLARDRCHVVANADDFDSALKLFMARRMSRFRSQAFTLRASVTYRFDPEAVVPSTSTAFYSYTEASRPNLLHFTCAVLAAHRFKLSYTAFEYNCFWFASSIIFILNHHFEFSHRVNIDKRQGTVKVPASATLTHGELKEDDHENLVGKYENSVRAILFSAQVRCFYYIACR